HGDDARHGLGGGAVDGTDAGVGVGTADEGEVQGTGDVQVVDEAGLTGEQLGVLLAEHPGSEDGHCLFPRRGPNPGSSPRTGAPAPSGAVVAGTSVAVMP